MDSTPRRSGGGVFEGIYKLIMRRNSIYVTFVIAGAFAGERAVDYGVRKLWEYNNVGISTYIRNFMFLSLAKEVSLAVVSYDGVWLTLGLSFQLNVMKIFQFWGKGQQKNELPSSSSHFEDSEQALVL
ncbi:hypothetical protein POTOM_035027 [Populus tomentosa]|uniref:Complex III subunit 9 n=1 Tax=Populus tomentosa TaxID=118781 RepID=A0A8X7Z860_POPTO|nr:hypothetical protein POTOM_035027 [Populus tomentosa]